MSDLLTASEVAGRLGISARQVYDLAASGTLPGYRFGRSLRFDPQDITEYKTQCRSTGIRRAVSSSLSLTVGSVAPGSALESAFHALGLRPITVPAGLATLRRRLNAQLEERNFRRERPGTYGLSISDQWLEDQIRELEAAIDRSTQGDRK